MSTFIDWDLIAIPDYETPQETNDRLEIITTQVMQENNIAYEPSKNSPGFRPSVEQARQVAVMSCLALSPKDIANVLNIELKLLKLYYSRELTVSVHIANAVVARQALAMATSGKNPDMTKFWLKTRAKWKETSSVEIVNKDGDKAEVASAKDRLAALLNAKAIRKAKFAE